MYWILSSMLPLIVRAGVRAEQPRRDRHDQKHFDRQILRGRAADLQQRGVKRRRPPFPAEPKDQLDEPRIDARRAANAAPSEKSPA